MGNILPDGSAEAAMNQGIVVLNEGLGEALQIGSILCGQFSCCPLTGLPSGGVKLGGIQLSDGRPIVVSGHAAKREFSEAGDTLVGLGPVANQVPQAEHLVDMSQIDLRQDRFQGGQIAMDVGEDEIAHPFQFTTDRLS